MHNWHKKDQQMNRPAESISLVVLPIQQKRKRRPTGSKAEKRKTFPQKNNPEPRTRKKEGETNRHNSNNHNSNNDDEWWEETDSRCTKETTEILQSPNNKPRTKFYLQFTQSMFINVNFTFVKLIKNLHHTHIMCFFFLHNLAVNIFFFFWNNTIEKLFILFNLFFDKNAAKILKFFWSEIHNNNNCSDLLEIIQQQNLVLQKQKNNQKNIVQQNIVQQKIYRKKRLKKFRYGGGVRGSI